MMAFRGLHKKHLRKGLFREAKTEKERWNAITVYDIVNGYNDANLDGLRVRDFGINLRKCDHVFRHGRKHVREQYERGKELYC
jgi:hypothetical protein